MNKKSKSSHKYKILGGILGILGGLMGIVILTQLVILLIGENPNPSVIYICLFCGGVCIIVCPIVGMLIGEKKDNKVSEKPEFPSWLNESAIDKEKIEAIISKIELHYNKKDAYITWDEKYDSKIEGSGPYHSETYVGMKDTEDEYVFVTECIAPMAGHFSWEFLRVNKSEISNNDELYYLRRRVAEKVL